MGITRSKNLEMDIDSLCLGLKEFGSSSQVDNPSTSNSQLLVDVNLPQDLITEILVRLPVKSLLRFKCVSKTWLSLISNPQFITSHFSKSSSMDEVENSYVQLLYATDSSMNTCCLYSALHEAHPKHVSGIELPEEQNTHPVVGIINGLVCLNLKETDLCVWNPALNKIKHLKVHSEPPSSHRHVEYFYSFGYDESNDDYKVVCFQTVLGHDGVSDAEVRIYSLKADSWRRIGRVKGFYLPSPGVFANGKIYWFKNLFRAPKRRFFSLDMLCEQFMDLQHPDFDAGGKYSLELEVSGGRPFVLCDYYQGDKVDLWVLDKRGVDESWSKLVSFTYTDVDNTICSCCNEKYPCFNYKFLCFSSNGEIVFGNLFALLVYNWKKKEYRNIQLVVGKTKQWAVEAYVESLVWPDYA